MLGRIDLPLTPMSFQILVIWALWLILRRTNDRDQPLRVDAWCRNVRLQYPEIDHKFPE